MTSQSLSVASVHWPAQLRRLWSKNVDCLQHFDSPLVLGVSQTLQRSTEGATYIRQGGHHVGHWPTFLVLFFFA